MKSKSKEEKQISIEKSFEALDKIIEKMNNDKCTIEENIKLYEEGSNIIKEVKKSIDSIEKKLEVLGK